MKELEIHEIDEVSGGVMTARKFFLGASFVLVGAVGLAVAPVALGAGLVAASVGIGTAGGVAAAGGALLLSVP